MIVDINMKQNSLRAWLLASRPKTLSGAAVPVLLGAAAAWDACDGVGFGWLQAVLCLLFAFIMQVDANFVNDYFDCVKGRDNEERLGPLRACQQGWVTLRAMRIAIIITSLLACVVGLPLAWFGGWQLIAVGVACLVFCFLYTTCLASLGMGDILVLVFFGVVPVCFTYYLAVPAVNGLQHVEQWPWLLSVACGLIVDTLLIVNNYRDIDNDRNAGKKTLVVYIGKKAAEWLYISLVSLALVLVLFQYGWDNLNMILAFGVYILYTSTWNKMRAISAGRRLNEVLGLTARNIFVFGILISLLVILS